jgi:Zn-dependent protease with chaperone function
MTPSYLARLLLLSSASFFLVQLLASALVAWIAPAAIERARTMRARRAARVLLTLRLLPAAFSTLIVVALCVPSYLRFEPRVAEEEAGMVCAAAAILGAAVFAAALYRTLRALIRSSLYVRQCGGRESNIGGEKVWIVPQSSGVALAGLMRPRLLISERAIAELSGDQLAVALGHERAHRASRDNLKRLLILLAPAIFPGLRALESAWIKCAEWAADDRAAEGDPDRSVALAAALVRVARLQSGAATPALVTSLVEADEDLSFRVDRLLHLPPAHESNLRIETIVLPCAVLLIASIACNPSGLHIVHQMLENLLD